MKAENKDTFSTSKAIKQIISASRLTKQKTTKITPFEAHFGRPANTSLRNISTTPSSLNLTYEKSLITIKIPIQFLQTISWMKPDGSTPKEVISKSKKPCVGHSRTQAAAFEIQTTRNRGSTFIQNSRTAFPEKKNHSMSSWLGNSLTKREWNANSLAYMKFCNLDPLWQNPPLQRQSLMNQADLPWKFVIVI